VQSDFVKKFYVVGVNFQKTDTQHRSKFSITSAKNEEAYTQSSACLEHFLILSTCNARKFMGLRLASSVACLLEIIERGNARRNFGYAYIKEGMTPSSIY